jgi:hypothetical protein
VSAIFADGEVGILQLLFIDVGVVDAIDVERAERVIVRNLSA